MANPTDKTPENPEGPVETLQTEIERQTIREVISERVVEEREGAVRAQRLTQRQVRDERAETRKKARQGRITQQKQQRVSALAGAQTKVQSHVGDASRALKRALSAAQAVPLPRHSPEGREQSRVVRSISAALGSLRAVGRSAYSSSDGVDLDFDDFDVGATD